MKLAFEQVFLSPVVVAAWARISEDFVFAMQAQGRGTTAPPDEELHLNEENTLLIRVEWEGASLELEVPPGHWGWAN